MSVQKENLNLKELAEKSGFKISFWREQVRQRKIGYIQEGSGPILVPVKDYEKWKAERYKPPV